MSKLKILNLNKYGILSFHHGDNRQYRGGPAGFWEVYERNNSSGFIYYVTLRGVTGSSNLNSEEIIKNIDTIKKYAKVPTLAGFGIKSEEDAKLLSKHSDGVIIGSSIVKMIEDNSKTKEFAKIGDYLVSMKKAIT